MKESDPFEKGLAAGEAAASAAGSASPTPTSDGRMYVRTQGFGSSDEDLRFLQRCGVRHKAAIFPFHPDRGWDLDELVRERERHESYGLTLDMSAVPIYEKLPNIIYFGKSPERDREIDQICGLIRNLAAAGIPAARWGPGDIGVAHRPDEFGEVADLEGCLALLARLGGHLAR